MNNDLKIKEFFSKNELQNVLFDMDNTLTDTSVYYRENMTKAIHLIIKTNLDISEDKQNEKVNEIYSFARETFLKNGQPMLVSMLTEEVVVEYFKRNAIQFEKEKIDEIIEDSYKNFYNISPLLFPSTLDTLHLVNTLGIKMGVYSHAQHDWTEIKIENIKKQYREKYRQEIVLPFFTTDIENLKDTQGWRSAGEYHDFEFNNTLVVGDSLTSDIYPAIEAGFQNLIYLSHGRTVPELETNSKVYITEDISNLFSFL